MGKPKHLYIHDFFSERRRKKVGQFSQCSRLGSGMNSCFFAKRGRKNKDLRRALRGVCDNMGIHKVNGIGGGGGREEENCRDCGCKEEIIQF